MRIVLTDKELDVQQFPVDVKVNKISYKDIDSYNRNCEVVAIAGSRAMAIKANQLDIPMLQFFQLTSAGFDGVPLAELKAKGIKVANAGTTYSAPIAETVVFGMLSMAKKLHANPNNRHVKIQRHYCEITELLNKKVMIIGAGSIGTEIAKRLSGFDMTICGYAQRSGERPFFDSIVCGREELMQSIGEYDYIISTLPENETTNGFINKELIGNMKSSAVILNVGRQAVFNQDDLYEALKNKRISGAVLDMFEKIPNPLTNRFRRSGNVIVLPGVAAISQEVNERLKVFCSKNILRVLESKMPMCIISEGN